MASPPDHEPTMEEILASIRKIISEDSSGTQAPSATPEMPILPPPRKATVAEPSAGKEDVLELTEVVDEEPSKSSSPETYRIVPENDIAFATVEKHAAGEPAPEPEPVLELELEPEPEPVLELEPEPEPVLESESEPALELEPEPDETIFSEKSRQALDDALANIDLAIEEGPKAEPQAPLPANGEQTLGTIILNAVREKVDPAVNQWLSDNRAALFVHLKPIIREWLDENFPAMLEKTVRGEVARVVKSRTRH